MIKDYVNGFVLNLQFLTRIPVPVKIEYSDRAFAAGSVFAPAIGLLIGLVSVCVYLLFGFMDKRPLALLLAMAAEITVTGGLHLDGLADTFDGIFSYRDRSRVLEIMKDSRLGTGGAIGLVLALMLKYVMLASLPDRYIVPCLAAMPVLSRMTIAWSAGLSPYARKDDKTMAAGLVRNTGLIEIIISTTLAVVIGVLLLKLAIVPLALIVIAFTLILVLYMKFRIGGVTGDVIGAVIELSELMFLFSVIILDKLYSLQHMKLL
ncbi:MAG: adenosylcobinamide-GDP ribazoletransferase [Spirochaetes bacterium]|nr:adenosylcobinamide-GDP ribazoletransferase [Spirochaetota bacterium]